MHLIRHTVLAAALAFGLIACSGSQSPTSAAAQLPTHDVGASGDSARNPDPVTTADAATLEARLVELGWAGSAATTHAYAEACGASAAQLDLHLAAQRAQAANMGTSTAAFDQQFQQALPIATQRVLIDDMAMRADHRAETCRTVLASMP